MILTLDSRERDTHSIIEANIQPAATAQPLLGSDSTTLNNPLATSPAAISPPIPVPPVPLPVAAAANPNNPAPIDLLAGTDTVGTPENSRQSMTIETHVGPPS